MHSARSTALRLGVAALILGLAATAASGNDRSLIRVPFEAAAPRAEAAGWLVLRIAPSTGAELTVVANGLEPRREYALRLGGRREARVRADANGTVFARYPVGASPDYRPGLSRDPRGEAVSLALPGRGAVLEATLGGPFDASGRRYEASVALAPTSLAPAGGAATVRVSDGPGSRSFQLVLEALPAGRYSVYLDGRWRRTVEVAPEAAGSPTVAYVGAGGGALLGRRLEVRGARGRVFEGRLRAALPRAPAAGLDPVSVRVVVPDFVSKQVEGVTLWRRELSGGPWHASARIRIHEMGTGELWYRAFDPETGEPLGLARRARAQVVSDGTGRAFTLEYARPAPAAEFKVSTFNRAGESPASRDTARR